MSAPLYPHLAAELDACPGEYPYRLVDAGPDADAPIPYRLAELLDVLPPHGDEPARVVARSAA